MKCPFCGDPESKVIDSRVSKDGGMIRRRRECEVCQKRFTTYERVEEMLPLVVKKDGRREPYDRGKVITGLKKACEKRPISVETIEKTANDIEAALMESGEAEVPSSRVGEQVMQALKELDDVAYVRFASVYRSFKDIGEFVDLIQKVEKES
ncbi:transcriptional repressor NrdR [Deltaproteobacteria bacterium PRO3]|nr:MAG: transcriptional repressor NrdR [bacterium]MDL1871692.1 transcriptional repressor NrdR [Deltaproteobacteria bacterium PRO3]